MKAARIFILAIASCISRKESSSLVDETQVFLSNDNQNDTNIYNKITLFDSMLKEFDYLFSFYCFADRMKKRYDSKWFVDHQTTAEDVQPYYFLHIHKNGGMTVVKELEVLLKDEYWCQSETSYISGIKDKSIFPYKKPRVITFIRKPLNQVLSSYRMGYDLAIAKGRSREDMRMDKKLVGDIDHCFDDQICTDRYANFQSRILGRYIRSTEVGISIGADLIICSSTRWVCTTAPFATAVAGPLRRFHMKIITPATPSDPLPYPETRRQPSSLIVNRTFRSTTHPSSSSWRSCTRRRPSRA